MQEPLRVIISLDVEEEGLFSGRYERQKPKASNVAHLLRLKSLSLDLGLPLTLLCAYSVFTDKNACFVLEQMRDQARAEIGAHLHHWNTPPVIEGKEDSKPERSHTLARELLKQKLASLLEAGRNFQGEALTSFRMGRWDLKAELLPLLIEHEIRVDSSICPLRAFAGGPDHFLAPNDPYWHKTGNGAAILEAPITQLPIFPQLAHYWHRMWSKSPDILDAFHFFGAISANPLWHSAALMRQAVRTHVRRGGKVLNLFLHSSELMPGASPHVPDQRAADGIVEKLSSFCRWLFKNYNCQGITMRELPDLSARLVFPALNANAQRDW